jgi:eukaryotic-like serine/threonine-protein kinase
VTIQSGNSLGPYQIIGLLGAGGMGEVYRAKDTRLDRIVAIKVLPPHLSTNADLRRRFEQEARAVSGLNHPHICALYDIGAQDGTHYLVMEYLDGETLRSRLGSGSLSVRKAIDFAVQIASALSSAHEKGVVHRDLKPENIFITRDERIKLLDFGLAHYAPAEAVANVSMTPTRAKMTEPGMVMGTVGYMSPEQVRGQEIDSRSDIFSLGTVLYEMLTGRAPFARETSAETMTAILREDPSELQGSGKNIPIGLASVVQRCMEKKPDLRFQTAQDLAFALQMTSQSTTIPAIPSEPVKISRSARLLWPMLTMLSLVAAVVAGYLLMNRSNFNDRVAFRQLSFRRGYVGSALIAPDGHTVIYSAMTAGFSCISRTARYLPEQRNGDPLESTV